jgi:2-polyprenyl-3-methyl-5-hydroxy-6-metoxy-1,4-benzoquinol methylase
MEADEDLRVVLRENLGFDEPDRWLDYARRKSFKRTAAMPVRYCPDCAGAPEPGHLGQYVYYSTLIRLLACRECGLIWANARIDPNVIETHFAVAYKDDLYFRDLRKDIFDHLVSVVDRLAPSNGRVLDIGGARGDLMSKLVDRRPELRVTVNDLSKAATDWASARYGFDTVTGGAAALAGHDQQYDVVVLSDVLYYEPDLKLMWSALGRLVRPGGSIVLRIPNKSLLISLRQWAFRAVATEHQKAMQDHVSFFNPEHIFVFRQRYLRNRLQQLGFTKIQVLSSPLLRSRLPSVIRSGLYRLSEVVSALSRRKVSITPGTVIVAARSYGS